AKQFPLKALLFTILAKQFPLKALLFTILAKQFPLKALLFIILAKPFRSKARLLQKNKNASEFPKRFYFQCLKGTVPYFLTRLP
ncbi:MAG: hypothetical protein K2H96_08780, partial [Muribaculaceae bacterium]|nr:hypothetical protein [Muribaculaceae bacterium]